jgi:glycosyltransferase involved in cell wall biosynthesis
MSIRNGLSGSVIAETPSRFSPAIVISPAQPGVGGQGAAAADMLLGLRANGIRCSYVGPPGHAGLLAAAVGRRPLRRWPALARAIERRAVLRRAPGRFALAYGMPGFVPRDGPGVRVLHHATHHPRRVREALAAARRRAGGGRGFMTAGEARMLEAEIARSDLVRTESAAVTAELADHGVDPARIVTALPGVDSSRYRPGEPFGELTLAFVGVLSLWKGVDVIVDLARKLAGRGRLAVVGGPVCPWSRALVAGAPLDARPQVAPLLAGAHALVLPSASDGFGYVVLEAMASGTVPFVSPEVGAAEVVRRIDPRLVQPREQFADAVVELLDELPLPELARKARTLAEGLDGEAMAERAAAAVLRAAEHR